MWHVTRFRRVSLEMKARISFLLPHVVQNETSLMRIEFSTSYSAADAGLTV